MELTNYILDKLRTGKEVKIILKTTMRETDGYKHEDIDWLIDDKILLEDMPMEVFEGEEIDVPREQDASSD